MSAPSCLDSSLSCVYTQVFCKPGICPAEVSSPLSRPFFATPGQPAGT